jgi:hypothetical protein
VAAVVLFLESPRRSKSGNVGFWIDTQASGVQLGLAGEL